MPDLQFEREANRMACTGIDLNRPVDALKGGKFAILENVRTYQEGRIEPRPSLTSIDEVVLNKTPVHSLRRLNNDITSSWARIIGTNDRVAYGTTTFTNADGAYSGDPLAMVPFRPDQSPEPWMYIADRSRQRKINQAGTVHSIGLPPPTAPPAVALHSPVQWKIINLCNDAADWTQDGTAGAPGIVARFSTTIAADGIRFDTGSTGWCCIEPTALDANMRPGAFAELSGPTETVVIQSVHPATTSTTIAAIIYDAGTSGLCSIALTVPAKELQIDSFIRNTTLGGSETARVLAVIEGPNESCSIRVSTPSTWAAGNSVAAVASFRAYLVNTHAAADTISSYFIRSTVTTGTGTLTDTITLDLSQLGGVIPLNPEDYIHASLRVDNQANVSEIKLLLDVNNGTNDFTQNFYYKAIRAADLTPSVKGAQTLLTTTQRIIQRRQIDDSGYPSYVYGEYGREGYDSGRFIDEEVEITTTQTIPGDVAWTELMFRVSDLIRVGADDTRTLKNVAAVRLSITVTASTVFDFDSLWVGGGYGPDISINGAPYQYRFRARVSTTGAASNFSPPSRGGVLPLRQQVQVNPPQYTLVSEADVLDIERFGGVNEDWLYAGTVTNSAAPVFLDPYTDEYVSQTVQTEGQNSYQPWPSIGAPVSGTTGSVAGTTVNDSSTTFNLSWAPGTTIQINGIDYSIYRVISTSRLELYENAGSQSSVTWRIAEPTILANNFPCLWGPLNGTFFACGDPNNPGRLYWSNPDNPDSTTEQSFIDITTPSEPLMNGLLYNGRSVVFSSERMFQILPAGETWTFQEIPNGKGLFSRWAITRIPGPYIYFLSKDGIYRTDGGPPINITTPDLYPFFPSDGSVGETINGFLPPNIISSESTYLRLDFCDGKLYFNYRDTGSTRRCLVYDEAINGWFPDTYTPGVTFHYSEEGRNVHSILCGGADTTTGLLYQLEGTQEVVACRVRTGSHDQGDPRAQKYYGDIMLDAHSQGIDITAIPGFNNHSTVGPTTIVSTASRLQTVISCGVTAWQVARNISLDLAFTVRDSNRPLLYVWEPRWTEEPGPIFARSWETTETTHNLPGFQHLGFCYVAHVSTSDVLLTITVDGVAQTPIVIPHGSGTYRKTFIRLPVMKGKFFQYRLSSNADMRLYGRQCEFKVKQWGSPEGYVTVFPFTDFVYGAAS